MSRLIFLLAVCLLAVAGLGRAESEETPAAAVEENLGKSKQGSATDDEVVARDEERIKLDGMNVAQMKELRDASEKHAFEAEVSRMMKLIINSLYRNKEIFLRELISNSSDALDKIRFLSLTDKGQLDSKPETAIRIKADKENHVLHITDSGIGMTKKDLVNNLGTIAKSGTSEFVNKMGEAKAEASDLIGQFGVGFYSAFLVADTVVVTSKHNDDEQHIWESNAGEFTVSKDPRGNTLGRGTCVSLYLKEEAYDFVEQDTLKTLIGKYSQFINFPIYLWASKTIEVEEAIEDDEDEKPAIASDEEGSVESKDSESKPKTEKVEKTVWDWEKMNAHKPLWTRSPRAVDEDEYTAFYKSFTKDEHAPGAHMHFVAEGEVSFRSILFIPKDAPRDYENSKGRDVISRNMKLYVRRVFITDELTDLMPKYLDFIRGVVDSDDLPLNVSRENLQQHKLLKVIRKKLVRKALDMIKKIPADKYMHFFKQFGNSLKMGIIDDHSNRTRLAKLMRFHSSNGSEMISLTEYQERMKEKQEFIYFMAGSNVEECKKSPFVEQLLKKGFEVLYLIDPIDEYTLQQVAEFEGKKFQNVAKDGLVIGENSDAKKQKVEALQTEFKPLVTFLEKTALKDRIEKVVVSQRLSQSPCALVANQWGWSGNMDRIMRAQGVHRQNQESHMFEQKKIFEINPYHPLIKTLLKSVDEDANSDRTRDLAVVLYETAILRSGFTVPDTVSFASRIERMLRVSAGVSDDATVEEPEEDEEEVVEEEEEEVAAEEEEVPEEPTAEEEPAAEEPVAEPETKDEL